MCRINLFYQLFPVSNLLNLKLFLHYVGYLTDRLYRFRSKYVLLIRIYHYKICAVNLVVVQLLTLSRYKN